MLAMAYFRTEAEALHLAISEDGYRWDALNGNEPLLSGAHGPIRDPHISRDRAGVFHLFYTGGWGAVGISHAVSADLLSWGEREFLPVMADVPGARNCWAPECFFDREEDRYRLFWSSTVSPDDALLWDAPETWAARDDHRIWGTATRDFRAYEPASPFFDPGYSVIDGTLASNESEGAYLFAFKDERGENRRGTEYKRIHICTANRATGPWTEISAPLTPALTEAPALYRLGGRWIMLYDHFMEGYYGSAESVDGCTWTPITDRMTFPPGPRHASVLEVDEETARGLRRLI